MKQTRQTKKLFALLQPVITLSDLMKARQEGYEVRQHSPFGLSPEQYGRTYMINGYRFIVALKAGEIAVVEKVQGVVVK